jgi:hypothetical protein
VTRFSGVSATVRIASSAALRAKSVAIVSP